MDLSEKDAARSKWKLSQRHRQAHRGRGARGSSASRGGRHQAHVKDLGSNEDRYLEPEAVEHAGPVRKSKGADLAELLERADAYNAGFYYHTRANLLEDYGIPPSDALVFQGLSFDLQGLATCLSLLPRNAVLGTTAFDEEEGEGGNIPVAATAAEPSQGLKTPKEQVQQQRETVDVHPHQPHVVGKMASTLHAPESTTQDHGGVAFSQAAGTAALATAGMQVSIPGVKSPVLAPNADTMAQSAEGAASAASFARTAPPATKAEQADHDAGLDSLLAPQPAQQIQHLGQVSQQAEHDEELDFLLGMMDVSLQQGSPQQAQQLQSGPEVGGQPFQERQDTRGYLSYPSAALPTQQLHHAKQQPLASRVTQVEAMPPMKQPQEQSFSDWLDAL